MPVVQRFTPSALMLVVALHALALYLVPQAKPPGSSNDLPVLSISLITPTLSEPVQPDITPPSPRPAVGRPAPAPRKDVAPLALPDETPAPAPAPVTGIAAPAAEHAVPPAPTFSSPAPAPIQSGAPTPPSFDADYLDNPKPLYPPLSRRLGEEGQAILFVEVAADGRATAVRIDASSGSPRLDQAAVEAVRRWRFVPARRGEAVVAASVRVPIIFSLKD